MMNRAPVLIGAVVLGLAGLAAGTSAQEDDLASVSAALAPRAEGLIVARCSVCHSSDLVSQQRLPKDRWLATVDKMKHWGAEISDDEADLLVRYLSARYHPAAPDHLPPLDSEVRTSEPLTQEPASTGPLVGVAGRGAGIFEHNCQACHGAGATGGMGPKLAKNPILKHEDLFWETVLHGRGPMPAWGAVLSHQDIADIHAWLLAR
ncbi:c-type cytochrome [Nitrospira sp. NS4]|uniref:c-type cytochrome n=1 Tax=Nitrospira sp. NS4 TaxID=3414498 RepID=UPI003C2AFFAF